MGRRTIELLTAGLPALHELIGLPWPVPGALKVEESANRLGDYAGIYNSQTETINVRYDADGTVTLHEAAHIWFNGELLEGRWIGEAWAEFYAVHSADAIGVTGETFGLTDDLLAAQIPLNDWEGIGVEAQDVEAFAYAASYYLAERIYERTDHEGLRRSGRLPPTVSWPISRCTPPGSREPRVPAPSGVAAPAGPARGADRGAYDDLWIAWVGRSGGGGHAGRAHRARARYVEVLAAAGPWELPEQIRDAMGTWQFEEATAELDTADSVLALADEFDTLAASCRSIRRTSCKPRSRAPAVYRPP